MVVDSSKYEINGAPDSTYVEFFKEDLDILMMYPDTARIGLYMAKCFTSSSHTSGNEHNIAVGIKSDGTLSLSAKAALPCPPDCAEKGITIITLSSYKYEGLAKFVSPELFPEFSAEVFDLLDKYKHKKKT